MTVMEPRYYSVSIETWGLGVDSIDPDDVAELSAVLGRLGALGPSTSVGGVAGGVSAAFGAIAGGDPSDDLRHAAGVASDVFSRGCEEAGISHGGIARLDIFTERYLERDLERKPERYAGVSELAELFDVSRQRVWELRRRPGFPAPIAEIAAGPVWTVSSLQRFLESWARKPGRPRRESSTG
jgi:hypothetical protein